MDAIIEVRVKDDHLARLVRSRPVAGIAELIWNSLDADAHEVTVTLVEQELGGIAEIRVSDNGHGMSRAGAEEGFGSLGGSWKRRAERSQTERRLLHGREGKGRWSAFAIGGRVRWSSVTALDGGFEKITVEGRSSQLRQFRVSGPVPSDGPPGTVVVIDEIDTAPTGLLGDNAINDLTARFALYLEQYSVTVRYRGIILDPSALQTFRRDYPLTLAPELGDAILTVIEWADKVERALILCDEHGISLEVVRAGVQAPGFDFTAYLKWSGFREREKDLALADLGAPTVSDVVEAGREVLRRHFKERAGTVTRALIENWKQEQVYPYTGEPGNPVETAERELFDIVALAAAKTVNRAEDRQARRLSLHLLREALEQSPGSLHRVLSEVLELPADKLEELDALLDRTTLTSVITSAKVIADRLDFLRSLQLLVFDPTSRRQLLERSQLHRILATETWAFGEEYNLTANDEALTSVLKKHLHLLGRDQLADETEVLDDEGRRLIVDLMLARTLPQRRNRREHLVVELKRPVVKIGPEEITQIQKYADAVASDERFSKIEVQWDFVVVSNDLTPFAERRLAQSNREPGLLHDGEDGVRVWVKTWAEIIAECEHRLKFVQRSLDYFPSDDHALSYLRNTHAKYLPPVFAEHSL